jgi:hypothetical protein
MLQEQIEREKISLLAGRIYEEGEVGGMVISTRAARRLLPEGVESDTLVGTRVSFMVARMPVGSKETESEEIEEPLLEGVELPSLFSGLPIEGLIQRIPFGMVQPVRLELTIIGVVDGAGTLTDFLGISLYVPLKPTSSGSLYMYPLMS